MFFFNTKVKLVNTIVLHRIVEEKILEWEDIKINDFIKLIELISRINRSNDKSSTNKLKINLTFDDGYSSDYNIAFPTLVKNNLKATFFIVPSLIGKDGYLNWENINEMSDKGMFFGSHGLSHAPMTNLTDDEAMREFIDSKALIESKIKKEVKSFSFPFGDSNPRVEKLALKSGYKYIYNSRHGLNNIDSIKIKRNSINSSMNISEIERNLDPPFTKIIFWKFEDHLKETLKKIIKKQNYIKLRNILFHNNNDK